MASAPKVPRLDPFLPPSLNSSPCDPYRALTSSLHPSYPVKCLPRGCPTVSICWRNEWRTPLWLPHHSQDEVSALRISPWFYFFLASLHFLPCTLNQTAYNENSHWLCLLIPCLIHVVTLVWNGFPSPNLLLPQYCVPTFQCIHHISIFFSLLNSSVCFWALGSGI